MTPILPSRPPILPAQTPEGRLGPRTLQQPTDRPAFREVLRADSPAQTGAERASGRAERGGRGRLDDGRTAVEDSGRDIESREDLVAGSGEVRRAEASSESNDGGEASSGDVARADGESSTVDQGTERTVDQGTERTEPGAAEARAGTETAAAADATQSNAASGEQPRMMSDAQSQMNAAASVASSMAAAFDAADTADMQGAMAGSAVPAAGAAEESVEGAVRGRAVTEAHADADALSGFMQTIASDAVAQGADGAAIAERAATAVAATDSTNAGARKDPAANGTTAAGANGIPADVALDASAARGDSNASDGDANTGGGQQRDERLAGSAASARAGQALDALANAVSPQAFLEGDAKPADGGGSALSARLAEVESSVARERIAKSIEQGLLEIDAGPNQGAASAANGAATIAPAAAGMMGVPGESIEFLANAAGGALGGDPAQDLARPLADPLPTGRLAAKGLDILSNHRGGAITMRLEPPALGQLRIELRVSQGAVVADFTAATAEARVLLEANLGMLRERLESQGLTVERMSVHGGGRGSEVAPVAQPQAGDMRQDSNNNGSDARDRGDRGNGRQDAAGGESRGRRDGQEQGRDRDVRGESRERSAFGGILESQRGQSESRRLRTAV